MDKVLDLSSKLDIKNNDNSSERLLIKEVNKDQFKEEIYNCKNDLKILSKELDDLLLKIENDYDYDIENIISEYERVFLKSKYLIAYKNATKEDEIIDKYCKNLVEIESANTNFECEIRVFNDDYLMFILPEMVGKREQKSSNYQGVFMQNSIINLFQKQLKSNNYNFKKMEKAMVVFEHHIDEKSSLNKYNDPDNIDAKKCLDGLNGLVIEDDTIQNLNLFHMTILDNLSYTKLHVIRKKYFNKWLQDNIKNITNSL